MISYYYNLLLSKATYTGLITNYIYLKIFLLVIYLESTLIYIL